MKAKTHRALAVALLAGSFLPLPAMAEPSGQPSAQQRAFADRMMVCNSHALFLFMSAQADAYADLPKRLNYRDLAYAAAGKAYVGERLESKAVRDQSVEEFAALMERNAPKKIQDMSEPEQDALANATWAQLTEACNAQAVKTPPSYTP